MERTLEALRLDAATSTRAEIGFCDDTALAKIAPFEVIELELARLIAPKRA